MFKFFNNHNGSNGRRGKNGKNGYLRDENFEHIIDIRKVVKTFENAAGVFTALKGIDLQVDAGEFVSIVGKSGCGKSTLINMITGIDRPTSGEVWVNGTPVHELGEEQIAIWRGQTIGIVFQFFQLLPTLTSVENVMLPMDYHRGYSKSVRPERGIQLLEQMEMAQHAHQIPTILSGGQQQVIAIARALANDPPILVADEPTGNLDSKTSEAVFSLFEQLAERGKTIVMVTHDNELANRTKRKIVLFDGVVVDQVIKNCPRE